MSGIKSTPDLPGYWLAQLNIRNPLDKQYYAYTEPSFVNVDPTVGVYPGAPLTAIG